MKQADDHSKNNLPDWDSLSEFNFLLYRRTVDGLNAALSALEVASVPGSGGMPPEWWYARSKGKIEAVLNLSMAWSWLIQFKNGVELTEQVIRPFVLQETLEWLNTNLQLRPPLYFDDSTRIMGNKQSIQEAMLLLHSVANTMGRVSLQVEPTDTHIRFVIKISRLRPTTPVASIAELLSGYGSHWRERSIAFELRTALDFFEMNHLQLQLADDGLQLKLWFEMKQLSAKRKTTSQPSPVIIDLREKAAPATLKLQHPNQWHLPPLTHRFDPLAVKKQAKIIKPIPTTPIRPGGWHKPKPKVHVSNPQHQTPLVVRSQKAYDLLDETIIPQRTELEESGGQDLQDRPRPKGTAHDDA